jgi:hypothetical protein
MPVQLFPLIWPLAVTLLLVAAVVITLAALTTLVAVMLRLRQSAQGKPGSPEGKPYEGPASRRQQEVVDTISLDGVHYFVPHP